MNFYKYNTIDTPEKLEALDKFLMNQDGTPKYDLISLDTETTGLLLYKTVVIGFSLAISKDMGFYLPLLQWIPDKNSFKHRKKDGVEYDCFMDGQLQDIWTGEFYPENVTPKDYRPHQTIIDYMNRWFSKSHLVMMNACFDLNQIFINTGLDFKDNLFIDIALMHHCINENDGSALKKMMEEYREELGINVYAISNLEQKEMTKSIIENGGDKSGEVWRADPELQSKYAIADSFYTWGIFEILMDKFTKEYGEEGLKWFFETEVMPFCKELVDIKRHGVFIDVKHFEKLEKETKIKMMELEDGIIEVVNPHLSDFTLGESLEEAVSNQRLIKKIIELENLKVPTKTDKKTGEVKETLAKAEVKKVYQQDPHWLWGFILGEDVIKYSDEKLSKIKNELYVEQIGRRYRFNVQSDYHLRWLFCDKLGMDPKSLPQTDSATKDNPIPSMKAEVLIEHMLPRYNWVKDLLTYKKLLKLYSGYIVPALELNIDGWLFMDLKQGGTVSGRLSCSGGLNLQTLPKVETEDNCCPKCASENTQIKKSIELLADKICNDCGYVEENIPQPGAIKEGFIAPSGFKIVNADWESLEPHCFAVQSGEERIKDIFRKGLDFYSQLYIEVAGSKEYSADPNSENFLKKKDPKKRQMLKQTALAIPYGSEDGQVANLLGYFDENGKPDYEKGRDFRDAYLAAFPKLKLYMHNQEMGCIEDGYVKTSFGRRRHFEFCPYINKNLTGRYIKGDSNECRDVRKKLFDAFIHAPYKSLQGKKNEEGKLEDTKINNTSIVLTEDQLKEFSKHFKIDYPKIAEGGYWAFVRSLAKQEYNNAKNAPIQGDAAHLANKAIIDVMKLIRDCGIKNASVVNQIHDEICLYVKEEDAELVAQLLQAAMEQNEYAKMLDIPLIAVPVICDNLKQSK